jgi:hypothetical protein
MERVGRSCLSRGLEERLRGARALASLIELAEKEVGGIAVEWKALLEILGVDASRVYCKPTGRTEVGRDFEGNWWFSLDPYATLPQSCEKLLYELARARYGSKGYYSSVEVEVLARLARWLAAVMPDCPPNPELVVKPTRGEVVKAVELARQAGVELDESLVREFERRPSSAALWALGALVDKLLGVGLEEAAQREKFLYYLAKTSRGGLPTAAAERGS